MVEGIDIMADRDSSKELLDLWRKLIEAGTEVWAKAAEQSSGPDQPAPSASNATTSWRPFLDQQMTAWSQMQGQGPVNDGVLAFWKKSLDDWIAASSKAEAGTAEEGTSKATSELLGQLVGNSRQLMDLQERVERLEDKLVTLKNATERSGANRRSTSKPRPRSRPQGKSARSSRKKREGSDDA